MTDARYEKLQETLDDRLCELERELDLKVRDVRSNDGCGGEVRGRLDTAETADADLQQDIGISAVRVRRWRGWRAAHTGNARSAAARSPKSA